MIKIKNPDVGHQNRIMNNVTIVMYHYVRDLKNSKFYRLKGLDIKLFIEQIEYIKKNYTIITAEEIINSFENGDKLPKKSILLTFDDGYIDHYLNVFPILDKHKIQGCFYIPAKVILENIVVDVNKIHFVLASEDNPNKIIKEIKLLLQEYQNEYNLLSFDYYYKKLAQKFRYDTKEITFIKRLLQVELEKELREKISDKLFLKFVKMDEASFSKELYVNKEQLKTMIRHGMHIGSHGFDHCWWNHLEKTAMEKELDLSIKFLSDIGVNMNNWTASYPYGSYDDFSVKTLREKGCKFAVTTEIGIADINYHNRFLLPRIDTNEILKKSCFH